MIIIGTWTVRAKQLSLNPLIEEPDLKKKPGSFRAFYMSPDLLGL